MCHCRAASYLKLTAPHTNDAGDDDEHKDDDDNDNNNGDDDEYPDAGSGREI